MDSKSDKMDKMDEKLDRMLAILTRHQVKSEGRITKLETTQKGITALLGTAIASFYSVVAYLMTGGD
tara:strand:- start:10585 stop:10785 length:201 start_codon:yes stop_codon:yes gene_type:complete